MSSPLALHPALPTLDDDAWEDLLNFIEERRVVPIIGPELLQVDTESGPRLLYEWVAERLAGKLGVDTSQLPKPCTLNDVVCWFLASRGRREEAYTRLRSIFRDASFAPPPALRQLAKITDFDLFVTTTFDSLLEQAVNAERFAGAQSTEVVAYAPNRVADLPAEREKLTRPVIYHLFGRLSASPTYVISDEDTLEFICALQSEHLTPEKLFHELEHNHLLFIGSSFTNWLATRASFSTGFRAPTPGQSNISDLATNINIMTGDLLLTATRAPYDPIAWFYGAQPLRSEDSENYSAGLVFSFGEGYRLSLDAFRIDLEDRIALTSRISVTAADRIAMAAAGIPMRRRTASASQRGSEMIEPFCARVLSKYRGTG